MDFLDIRKKARERATARTTGAPGDGEVPPADGDASPAAPPVVAPDAGRGAPAPAPTDADLLEDELAVRLQDLPPVADDRFTTWRPGAGAPPRVESVPPRPVPELRDEDFTVVRGLPEAEPAAAPPAPPAPAPARGGPLDEFFYRPDEEAPDLLALGADPLPARAEDPDNAVREEYLTFLLGEEEYAVAIERVREVLKAPPITEVPRAPAHLLGVVTVRGEVVAVLDPRRRLGLPGAPPAEGAGRIVLVDAGEGPCGLLVDAVSSVVRLRPGTIEPCPQGIGGAAADCLAGIGRDGERLFTVLDLGALFRRVPGYRARDEERHAGA